MESSPSYSASSPSSSPAHSDHPPSLTVTQMEQLRVEQMVAKIYQAFCRAAPHDRTLMLELLRDNHIEFLTRGLRQLGPSYHVLDANRPWLCYWILHSLALLDAAIDSELEDSVIDFLSRCQDRYGGYGGGPGQLPHLATTYAAVNTLVTLGSERAFSSINRDHMYNFLLRMKDSSGAFRMHDGGEIDVRACYTAISVATILNIADHKLVQDVGNYILSGLQMYYELREQIYYPKMRLALFQPSCQTYEGGIAGEPGSEAHGGYTFCGLATMVLINEVDRLDLPSLLDWVTFRQGVECGFQGRTNKLVDGCYSFWQGGVLALMQRLLSNVGKQLKTSFLSGRTSVESLYTDMAGVGTSLDDKSAQDAESSDLANNGPRPSSAGKLPDFGSEFIKTQIEGDTLFNSLALQQYIILCSQVREGGFRDKPGKFRDHYHSCYCLSGLSVSQFSFSKDVGDRPPPCAVLGSFSNLLQPIHPLHNVVLDQYHRAHEFFSRSTLSG